MAEELPEISVEPPPTPASETGDLSGLQGLVESRGNPTGQNEGLWGPADRPDLLTFNSAGGPDEVCVIVVNGQEFSDWETVWVQWNWAEWWSNFRFTCAEREPYPERAPVMQFKPGDLCMIYLGGIRVITGVIITRQVAYDANNHGVMLVGKSLSWYAARSSIIDKDSDYDNKTFLQIADKVLAPTGIKYQVLGQISQIPFKSGARPGGKSIGEFLDELARDRDIIVSNTPTGDFLFIGNHSRPVSADLLEGENIKKMQFLWSHERVWKDYVARAQSAGDNQKRGTQKTELEAKATGAAVRYTALLTYLEHPVYTQEEVALRNDAEVGWNDGQIIQATITTYGWFREAWSGAGQVSTAGGGALPAGYVTKNHALWQAGDEVRVHSPMAMINNQVMKIQQVTWTQSRNSGSETTMLCVPPFALNGGRPVPYMGSAAPTVSQANTGPATSPPSQY